MTCPVCPTSLDGAPAVGDGSLHCTGCGYLWVEVDGHAQAVNTGGPLTAARAAALIATKVDR